MSARRRRAALIWSAVLGVLVSSCGAPSVFAVTPAPQGAQQQPAAQQPRGGLAQVAEPGRKVPDSAPVQRRPSGNSPGVAHELPRANGSDLSGQRDWERQRDIACMEAVGRSDCLKFDINVFETEGGKEMPIRSPGPDYGAGYSPAYSECPVTNIDPPNSKDGGPKYVSPGTTIAVKVVCIPAEPRG